MSSDTRRDTDIPPQPRVFLVNADLLNPRQLADGGSGQLHAACSSGKSLMAMRAAERLTGPRGLVVVLAPSLALVSQILGDWQRDSVHEYRRFAVCSDVAKRGKDEDADESVDTAAIGRIAELSTDVDVIAKWVTAEGPRLIVGTYVSALRLADAVRRAGTEIDMLICDEAHHLAGNADSHTRRTMDPAVLPTARRLYMTGTPRIGADRDETKTVRMLSMDDETVFGPVFYSYPFSRGIAEGYLSIDMLAGRLGNNLHEEAIEIEVTVRAYDREWKLTAEEAARLTGIDTAKEH